jgi:predicted transcriptional regulator
MRIEDIVKTDFPKLHTHEDAEKAIQQLIQSPERSLPVFDENDRFVGELSQEDLLLEIVGADEMGGDFDMNMIRNVLSEGSTTIDPMVERHTMRLQLSDSLHGAIRYMYEEELSTLPVFDGEEFKGILTDIEILKHFKQL